MDGAFVSYHNTQRHFGFEYISTDEINRRVFGSTEFSDAVFMVSSKIMEVVLDEVLDDLKSHDFEVLLIIDDRCSDQDSMLSVQVINWWSLQS